MATLQAATTTDIITLNQSMEYLPNPILTKGKKNLLILQAKMALLEGQQASECKCKLQGAHSEGLKGHP